jgi:uncharacterized protein YndB with AHSA1/START domain
MTLYRKVLLGTGLVLVLAAGGGLLLPRSVHVERTTAIRAPRPAVFAILNSFARFNEWSPWAPLDPNAKYSYDGPATGVGARMTWVGDPATLGSGAQAITESRPPEIVKTAIDFGTQGRAALTFTLTETAGGTTVTWAFDTDLGMNPVSRYVGLAIDTMVGNDFERGLARLKVLAEK